MKIGRTTLEACHAGPSKLNDWLRLVRPLISRDLGHTVAFGVASLQSQDLLDLVDPEGITGRTFGDGRATREQRGAFNSYFERVGALTRMSAPSAFRLFYQPFRVTTADTLVGARVNVAQLAGAFLAPGFVDIGCIRADGHGYSLTAVAPLRAAQSLPFKDRGLLRLQRHLAGAFAKRVRPAWERSAVVLDASGAVVHCDVKRAPPQLHELRSLVARELDQRPEPDERAELVWDELWRGGWTVARVDDADGRRYLTLRRARANQPTLTTSERAVLALAREGRSIKWIAAEFGISNAGVSMQLQSGLRKLGLKHRLELERLR